MLEHEAELTPIIEKYCSKTAKSRYLDFNQGVDGRKINDENMAQLARLAIKPLRIAFDDIMFSRLVKEMAIRQGVTEQLKAADQMAWVGKMNNIRNQATEIVNQELIYV